MTTPEMQRHVVLLVDDNEANLYLLRVLLEGHGCDVATAGNGVDALALARRHPPDLVVSDILMPGMDGFALCREWKKDEHLKSIPFVFYTATYTDEQDRQFGLSLGAERFLVKPEEPDVLVQIILDTMGRDRHQSGRALQASDAHAAPPAMEPEIGETDYLTLYNRSLVHKLEAKMGQLEQANIELRESHRDLEEAQRIANIGSWTMDPTTGATSWSPEMYRILGLDPAGPAVPFADMLMQLSSDDLTLLTDAVERAARTGDPWRLEVELARPDGKRGRAVVNGVVDRDHTGAVVGIHGTMQDITEQSEMAAQLRQSQRMEAVGLLAGGVAHDFNNLLTAIRGYAELARGDFGPEDDALGDLDQIVLAADRAAELTRQLLAFSRRQVLRPKVLDPAEIVAGVTPLLRRLLGEHIELETHSAPQLGRVEVDPSQLEQVIVNLAVNARDAMPAGGKLTIGTANVVVGPEDPAARSGAASGNYVALTVSDTGVGIDQSTLSRIFEPFFTTKEPGRGTGMGLATVYGIVHQSGGSIHVETEPGRGSTFTVLLPTATDGLTPMASEAPPRSDSHSRGTESILLVEDEAAVRGFASRVLQKLGYAVVEASSGSRALELASAHSGDIHLLITDLVMPGLQGQQLASELHAVRPGMRVLYVSGFTDSPVGPEASPAGTTLLAKPFSAEELGRAVREVLDATL